MLHHLSTLARSLLISRLLSLRDLRRKQTPRPEFHEHPEMVGGLVYLSPRLSPSDLLYVTSRQNATTVKVPLAAGSLTRGSVFRFRQLVLFQRSPIGVLHLWRSSVRTSGSFVHMVNRCCSHLLAIRPFGFRRGRSCAPARLGLRHVQCLQVLPIGRVEARAAEQQRPVRRAIERHHCLVCDIATGIGNSAAAT